jgi:hypothetical protein
LHRTKFCYGKKVVNLLFFENLSFSIEISRLNVKYEAKVILAKFIKNFDFKLDETQSFDVKQDSTLKPVDDVRCFLTERLTQ